jgi:hypothetical protein
MNGSLGSQYTTCSKALQVRTVLARWSGGVSATVFRRYHSKIDHLQQALQAPTDDDLQCFRCRGFTALHSH